VELLPQKIAMNEGYGPVVGCAPFVTEFWNRKIIFLPREGKVPEYSCQGWENTHA